MLDYKSRNALFLQSSSNASESRAGLAALIELTSEPLYILAQARMQIGLRVSIEAAATIVKILATVGFLVQGTFPEATSISVAQVTYWMCHCLPILRMHPYQSDWHFVTTAARLRICTFR